MIHAILRGKRYRIVSRKLPARCGGLCDDPATRGKRISICSTIKDPGVFIENLIHEGLHGCDFSLSEAVVRETARDVCKLLVAAGVTVDVATAHERLRMK